MRCSTSLILVFISFISFGQDWAWMKGSNVSNQFAKYGAKNTSSPAVNPGARGGSLGWKSSSGELWLFGGEGYSSTGYGKLNDMFKYNVGTNNWTWVGGDTLVDKNGVYGTKGVAAPTNKPGARAYGATWVDLQGNLWLFGGLGFDATSTFGSLNDLWKYNITLNEWTWMSGSNLAGQFAVYGVVGVPNSSNIPGARHNIGVWTDAAGKFWMFGGYGNDASSFGTLNDLWKYDPVTNEWTWIKGDNFSNAPGVNGTMGVSAPANKPVGRGITTTWMDVSGKFWFFGGFNSGGPLDDLWKYDPITNQWAWMKGTTMIYQNGIYGTMNVGSSANNPGGRSVNIGWKDGSGDFWLFGGYGLGATTSSIGYMNDMWKYSVASNDWIWQNGPTTINQPSNYGTQGVPSPFNIPGARSNSTTWVDNSGDLWLFGSAQYQTTYTNDLWKLSNPVLTFVEEKADLRFSVYPNPAADKLYVKADSYIQKCTLIDMSGRTVYESLERAELLGIDLSGFASGVYSLKLISAKSTSFHRVNIVK